MIRPQSRQPSTMPSTSSSRCATNSAGRPPSLSPGGGWGVPYHEDDLPHPCIDDYVASSPQHLAEGCRRRGLPLPRLHLEPGRSIVARAGVAVYRVGTVKRTQHRRWLLVDGGLADNPRPALYGARYSALPVENPGRADDRPRLDRRALLRERRYPHRRSAAARARTGGTPGSPCQRSLSIGVGKQLQRSVQTCHRLGRRLKGAPRPAAARARRSPGARSIAAAGCPTLRKHAAMRCGVARCYGCWPWLAYSLAVR